MVGVREVAAVREAMAAVAAGFDPALLLASDAARVVREAAAIKNMAATVEALAAARATDAAVWRYGGHRSPADYLAKTTGTSVAQAREAIDTAKRLGSLPATAEAARQGTLSREQVSAISDAAAANPGAEQRLLTSASRGATLPQLREECQRAKTAADPDPEATHRRIHEQRYLRRFTDREGGWNLHVRNTPEAGAVIETALAPVIDRMFHAARLEGRREPHEAYAADALVDLARSATDPAPAGDNGEAPRRRAANVNHLALLRLDLEALQRGFAEGEECCEIAGIGPVPVSVARQLLGDSILKLVITKGVDVLNVTHLGRGPTAAQKVALLWSQPICSRLGCGRRVRLEFDHKDRWADTHETRVDGLDRLCDHDHDLKTRLGWALVEGTGVRLMVPPDDLRHANNRPPPPLGPSPPGPSPPGDQSAGREADTGQAALDL